MKILILSPLYYPDRFGGIEKVVYEFTRRLGLKKIHTTVICGTIGCDETVMHEDVTVHRISSAGAFNDGSFEKYYEVNRKALDIINQEKPDTIWAHDWFFALAALNYTESYPVPLISQAHFLKRFESKGRISSWRSFVDLLQTLLFRNSKTVLAVSSSQIQSLSQNYRIPKNKICYVKYGMDQLPLASQRSLPNAQPVFLYLGRLETEKNIDTFLDSLRIHENKLHQPIHIQLVGSGSLQKALEEKAQQLSKVQVEFIPFSSDFSYIQSLLMKADIVVLPSLYDSYGLAALEALSLQVPVLVSRQCGISEDLSLYPKNMVFDARDKEEMFKAVQFCLNNLTQLPTIGIDARRNLQATHNWDLSINKILEHVGPSKKRVYHA